jgi:hypothetical protein
VARWSGRLTSTALTPGTAFNASPTWRTQLLQDIPPMLKVVITTRRYHS